MRVLVIAESYWGNTATIADTIATALIPVNHVRRLAAGDVNEAELRDVDLVIVGAPTHVHGMPGRRTREVAARKAESPATGEGVRELLARMVSVHGAPAAAFDTRLPGHRLFTGAASVVIARHLRRLGYRVIVPPESFIVEGKDPVLAPGELQHARAWAQSVIDAATHVASHTRPSSMAPAAHA